MEEKGEVCVTGGTGYIASWLIKRLLEHGYTVRATVRSDPSKKDMSYLTNLPRAKEKLQIFIADLRMPESFNEAINGCTGVFLVAHPMNSKEPEEVVAKTTIQATFGILRACLNSKTVKRVVYTSSVAAVLNVHDREINVVDENIWSDIDYVRELKLDESSYSASKILVEKAALDFAKKNGLDLVTLLPSLVFGPFLAPQIPSTVTPALSMILGLKDLYYAFCYPLVHVDDVASAHIFLLEYSNARGRYICSAEHKSVLEIAEFLAATYPEYPTPTLEHDINARALPRLSTKKLLDTGFKYQYGLREMFDDAIQCCKTKGLL
ncbi:NAD-dependent epimerase/dehydratase [Dillenia turbinata]|uniref:NAD-dependent epimerase/dehydratase n=1 Tax=Dillenia turbinata TaxID=194707 RepID=A0AAN8UMW9_9MAGN